MTSQQLGQLELLKTSATNAMNIYNDMNELSRLDFRNPENVVIAVNFFRQRGYKELRGINTPSEFKKYIKESRDMYYRIAKDYESKYDEFYQQVYFPYAVHQVGY